MVTLDLDVKAIVGLADNSSISEKDFKAHLEKFEKTELINYLASDIFNTEQDAENDSEELDDEDY